MKRSISIDLEEAKRVFYILEKLQSLTHQPLNYGDSEIVEKFADENDPEIHELYYDGVWDWLPADVQKEMIDR